MDQEQRIPSPVIGLLGEIFSDTYTHSDIDRLFTFADAPEQKSEGNKVQKTVDWLRLANKHSDKPLEVLGALLEDILEKEGYDPDNLKSWDDDSEPEWSAKLKADQARILAALAKAGLSYSTGGRLDFASASPTKSLLMLGWPVGKSKVALRLLPIKL